MIPTRDVITAVAADLATVWPAGVGDGEPLPDPDPTRPTAWITPQGSGGPGPRMGGGEPTLHIRVRVSVSAVDGDSRNARTARIQAQGLADDLRHRMLTAPMWTGPGWRVTGRWHDSTATVPEPGAWTIHQDFILHAAVVSAASPDDES